ncbi:hypothetical protein PMAYCL1PPCAC_12992, partial [Pristionchus mayeri]
EGIASPLNFTLHHQDESNRPKRFSIDVNGVTRNDCFWYGKAPLCGGECPANYDQIERRSFKFIPEGC